MNVVFLDIDGVLATEESCKQKNHELYAYPFDADCVKVFNQILLITNAEIVLSSDWRLMYNNEIETLDLLFKHNGVIKSPIDVTPNLGDRQKEIESFVYGQKNQINSFVILDDMDLKIFPNNFIKCNLQEGIKQLGIRDKIITVLNSVKK